VAKHKNRQPEAGKTKYQPTEQEKTALGDHIARLNAAPTAPRIKVTKDASATKIGPDHPNELVGRGLLMEALGTADYSFGNGLIMQLANASMHDREVDEADVNFMLAVVKGIKPRDHLEAMLAAQMAAIHMATMTFTRRLASVESIPQQDSAERALNKLARTYATQMEALKRYRTGGEQKVTVQHVSVSEGGQAIVGNVTQASRETVPDQDADEPRTLVDARTAPMPATEKKKARAPVLARRGKK
jgi:hypothetical protein